MAKLVDIRENTRSVVSSFKRSDVRIRRMLASKLGKRRNGRTRQLLNLVSKTVVENAKAHGHVIVFEDITGIRKLFRKGNGQ